MAADRQEFFGGVSRRDRETLYSDIAPERIEYLSWAVNDIRHALAVSTPELTYMQAQAEQQAQSTLAAMNTPRAESWLTAATARGSDGAAFAGNHTEAYPTSMLDSRLQPVGSDGSAMGNVEALRTTTGISAAEERAMEANVAADRVNEVQAAPSYPLDSFEDRARSLVDEAFGPQEDQREFA